MGKLKRNVLLRIIGAAGVVNLVLGLWAPNAWLVFGGGIALAYVLLRLARLGQGAGDREGDTGTLADPGVSPLPSRIRQEPVAPDDTEGLVEQMLQQERFALLLRPQLAGNLAEPQLKRAMSMIEEKMALVPSGTVMLYRTDEYLESELMDEEEFDGRQSARLVNVDHFFLDRYPVTNRQYYEFVAAGGYEQMTFWDKKILPAVLDFVDRTGNPGPRYWKDGCCLRGQEDLPVVGICWYEAAAYARWVGKRLPTDAEWVKAGSWPVPVSDGSHVQRRYPWGDHMDRRRANLWGSGPGHLVPVDQYADGVSVGGVYQLIGNVWEWTSGNYQGGPFSPGELTLGSPMKSIRGGAFDTYFDNQASCQFQSGEQPLARKHNIGMRLAVGVCDMVFGQASSSRSKILSESEGPSQKTTAQAVSAQEVMT